MESKVFVKTSSVEFHWGSCLLRCQWCRKNKYDNWGFWRFHHCKCSKLTINSKNAICTFFSICKEFMHVFFSKHKLFLNISYMNNVIRILYFCMHCFIQIYNNWFVDNYVCYLFTFLIDVNGTMLILEQSMLKKRDMMMVMGDMWFLDWLGNQSFIDSYVESFVSRD